MKTGDSTSCALNVPMLVYWDWDYDEAPRESKGRLGQGGEDSWEGGEERTKYRLEWLKQKGARF